MELVDCDNVRVPVDYETIIDELIGSEGRLTRLKPEKVMEREALIAENLNKQLKFRAMPRQIYVI